jgi:hypothetical protein
MQYLDRVLPAGLRRHDRELALAVVLLVSALVNWHFASQSFFVADDILLFEQAVGERFTDLGFLLDVHGDHFAPGRRAVTVLLQQHAPLNYDLTIAGLIAAHSTAIVLLQRILRLLYGARWWTVAVAFAFGVSIVVTTTLEWFSAAILVVPETALCLASIHAYLCWWRTSKTGWLVWSAIALTGAVLFYEKAILAPLYILLIRLFVLESGRHARERIDAIVREWPVWLAYAVPVAGTLVAYALRDTGNGVPHLTAHVVLDYFATAWSAGFVPAIFGIRLPIGGNSAWHTIVVLATEAIVAGAVVASILRRRSAWVPWALVVLVFLLNAVLAFPRLGYGAQLGYVLRYFAETLYFTAIVVPFAFVVPCGRAEATRSLPRLGAPAAASAVLILATCAGFAWASDRAYTRHWTGPVSRSWFEHARGDLDRLHLADDGTTILDSGVPSEVIPFWLVPNRHPPINSLRAILPLMQSGLSFDRIAPRTYRARLDGHFERVEFQRAETVFDHEVCLGEGERRRKIEWVPRQALTYRDFYLVATYATDRGGTPFVRANRGIGYPSGRDLVLDPRPSGGRVLRSIGAIPGGVPTLVGLKFDAGAGHRVCFSRLVVGSFAAVP